MGNQIILSYVQQCPDIREEDLIKIYVFFKFKAYLQTTLRFTRKAYAIKKTENLFIPLPDPALYALVDENSGAGVKEAPYDVEWAMRQLGEVQFEVIRQYYYNGKTDVDIAREWGGSTRQNVNNIRRRGLGKMKKLLEKYG